jgi:hypothetical protein
MSKTLVLEQDQWARIHNSIAKDYPPSVLLIRPVMRKILGFTVRRHREWVPKMDGGYYSDQIHLDFYDEPKRLMFLLKYTEHIGKNQVDIW